MSMTAFCHSEKCTGIRHQAPPVVKENVSITKDNCPDCGHTLVWRKSRGEIRHYAKAAPKKTYKGERIYEWR